VRRRHRRCLRTGHRRSLRVMTNAAATRRPSLGTLARAGPRQFLCHTTRTRSTPDVPTCSAIPLASRRTWALKTQSTPEIGGAPKLRTTISVERASSCKCRRIHAARDLHRRSVTSFLKGT
jgi:hypothetical protein